MRILRSFFCFVLLCLPGPALAETPLQICVTGDNPPFAWHKGDGPLQGFDMDMWQALALPHKVIFNETDFPTALGRLESRTCDMALINISVTEARKQRFLFSTPYVSAGLHAMVMAESPITHNEELRERTVGVIKGSTSEHFALKNFKSGIIIALTSHRALMQLLRQGKIDAIIHDKPLLQKVASVRGDTRILEPKLNTEFYAYAFAKGREALRDEVNATLKKLEEAGSIRQFYAKWFGGEME